MKQLTKVNKQDLELTYEYDPQLIIRFGRFKSSPTTRMYTLKWKADKNPYSNDDDSKTRSIGYIAFNEENTQISYVYLKQQYRGTGVGKYMYSEVAKQEGYLTTNFQYASEDAQRCWKKLFKSFPTRKFYNDGTNYRIYPDV